MCIYLRQFNISLLVALIVSNSILFLSSTVAICLFAKIISENDIEKSILNFVYLIISTIQGLASLIITYYVGKRVIYFKMLSFLKIYLVNLIFFLAISILLLILKIVVKESETIKTYQNYLTFKTIIMIVSIVLTLLYLLSIIGLLTYKKNLETQVMESPLNRVSDPDSISDELYQNILEQSKDPNNPILKEEYRRLSQNKNKMQINSDSTY